MGRPPAERRHNEVHGEQQHLARLSVAPGSREACYDWQMETYQCSYFRSWNQNHIPLSRYLLPYSQFLTAVTRFNHRHMINQCLMYRYVVSYEPYNFKGRLDDIPLTLEYGKKMDALRRDLRDWFWDGEFRDTVGALVTAGGEIHHPYSVFLHAKTRQKAVVVSNYDNADNVTVEITTDDGQAFDRWRLVDDPTWRPASDIVIPPRSAAVVLPE